MKLATRHTSILSDFLNKRHEVAERCEQGAISWKPDKYFHSSHWRTLLCAFLSRDPLNLANLFREELHVLPVGHSPLKHRNIIIGDILLVY